MIAAGVLRQRCVLDLPNTTLATMSDLESRKWFQNASHWLVDEEGT